MLVKLNQTIGWGDLSSWTKPNLVAIQLVDQTLSEPDPTLVIGQACWIDYSDKQKNVHTGTGV